MTAFQWRSIPRIAILFIAFCAIFTTAKAQNTFKNHSSVVTTPQVRAELLAYAPDGIGAGKSVWVGLQLTHQPHCHTYWKNSGDSGQATELQWSLPAGVQAGQTRWPVPQKIWIGPLANYGYENTVLLPVPLEISTLYRSDVLQTDLEVKLKAVWLACKQECIPEEGQFVLKIPARGSTALHRSAFEAAFAAYPKDLKLASTAKLTPSHLHFSVSQLPLELRGKSLQLFPETPEVLENGAKLATVSSSAIEPASELAKKGATWSQSWKSDVWTAEFPLSSQRSASPQQMSLVLTADGKMAYRVEAKIDGVWPTVAAPPKISPELAAALQANVGASGTPVLANGQTPLTSVWPALLLALLGGMILNLMPCVFPVLAIKVLSFSSAPSSQARVTEGLSYTLGVMLSFIALGALMLALRAGGQVLGWGFQLQSPAVVATLALVFTLIALNLMGVFELSHFLPSSVATLQAKNPQVNAFLTGVLAVAVASPCTAPFMGVSLGFALGLPAWQALAVFSALGAGMALPYLAASLMPGLARLLPRPGAWMAIFKTLMAFPILVTVIWLVWVLGQQTGVDAVAAFLMVLLCVVWLLWGWRLGGSFRWAVTTISIASCAVFLTEIAPNALKIEEKSLLSPGAPGWQTWQSGKTEQWLLQGKPVFVDFTAAWCITCQYNKKTALANESVLSAFAAKNVQLLRADWTRRDPDITQALAQLGRNGVPVYVIYKPGSAPVILSEILSVTQLQTELAKL